MCLIVFSYKTHPTYKLILAANRDELYERPTRAAQFWNEEGFPDILAGKDLKGKEYVSEVKMKRRNTMALIYFLEKRTSYFITRMKVTK